MPSAFNTQDHQLYVWHPVYLYHAVTILVMFPVSIQVMNANIQCTNMAPDYYFVQPQFGYNDLEWIIVKMAYRDKGLYPIVHFVWQ